MSVNLAAIVDKPWPFVRGYLIKELGLGDRLDHASDSFAIGYLSRATRMDLGKICSRGQVCGSSCIPRKKQCSPDKQAATSKMAKEASAKARGKLIQDLKGERDRRRGERASKKLTSEKEIANVEKQQASSSPSAKKRNSTNMNTTTVPLLNEENLKSIASSIGISAKNQDLIDALGVTAGYMSAGMSLKEAVKQVNAGKTSIDDVPSIRESMSDKEWQGMGLDDEAIKSRAQKLGVGVKGDRPQDLFARMGLYSGFETISMRTPEEKKEYVNKQKLIPRDKLPKKVTIEDLAKKYL